MNIVLIGWIVVVVTLAVSLFVQIFCRIYEDEPSLWERWTKK